MDFVKVLVFWLWLILSRFNGGPSWSYGSLIYNCLCNQCLSPLILWVRIPLWRGVLNTILCDKVCELPATGRWFSLGTPVSSTNKTDRHNITEILLRVALNTITRYRKIKTWWDKKWLPFKKIWFITNFETVSVLWLWLCLVLSCFSFVYKYLFVWYMYMYFVLSHKYPLTSYIVCTTLLGLLYTTRSSHLRTSLYYKVITS
jgi:hypothetical protein